MISELTGKPLIEAVKIIPEDRRSDYLFQVGFSCLFIDIFSVGVDRGIDEIKNVREAFPAVLILPVLASVRLGVDAWRQG